MDAAAMDAAVVGKAMFVEAVGGGEVAEAVGEGAVEGAAVGEEGKVMMCMKIISAEY